MAGRRIAILALLLAVSLPCRAQEYVDVAIETQPDGVKVFLNRLDQSDLELLQEQGKFRVERAWFQGPSGEGPRTLILRLPDYEDYSLPQFEYGRVVSAAKLNQPLRNAGGQPYRLKPKNWWVGMRDNGPLPLLLLTVLGSAMAALLLQVKRKQSAAAKLQLTSRLRVADASEAQKRADRERSLQEAERRRAEDARREADARSARADEERLKAEAAERMAAREMAELRERNRAFQEGAGKDPWLGMKVNEYYLLSEKIGKGAQGAVYKAKRLVEHASAPDLVAVKIMDLKGRNEAETLELAARHRNEIAQGVKLTHPNFVRYFGGGLIADGFGFIILELIDGKQTLRSKVCPGGRPLPEVVRLLQQIVEALTSAHELGIVHRDLKPDNIFVAPGGDLKIGDLGLAKYLNASNGTVTDAFLGSPAYCAPEQMMDSRDASPLMDQYGVGIMAYELLTGFPPFLGDTNTVLTKRLTEDPPPLPNHPSEVNDILQKMLSRDPALRFANLRDALTAFLQLSSKK